MPTFKVVTEDGVWLEDIRLSVPDWRSGDRVHQGRVTLEVVEVRSEGEKPILVVRARSSG